MKKNEQNKTDIALDMVIRVVWVICLIAVLVVVDRVACSGDRQTEQFEKFDAWVRSME